MASANGGRQAPSRYHRTLVAIHWLVAVLVIFSLFFGILWLDGVPNGPEKIRPLQIHVVAGAAILLLMLIRIVLRFTTARPAPARTGHRSLDRLRSVVHFLFYVLILAMVSTGLGMALPAGLPEVLFGDSGKPLPESFGVYPPREGHGLFSRLLLALIVAHVAGALYHQFVLKDGLLRRMWFRGRDE